MFGWFRPSCPLPPPAKQWVEERLEWLADQFGRDVFVRRSVIQPTDDYFPDRYDRSFDAVQNLFEQVCGYMDVDSNTVSLRFFKNGSPLYLEDDRGQAVTNDAAGLYEDDGSRTLIHLDTGQFHEPADLVGTMAHELAHVRLLGEGRVSPDIFDNELLTDLTVVFHGLGIFLANSPRNWPGQNSFWPGTEIPRPEYMSMQLFGYALAHAAWLRREEKPEWAYHLRPNARSLFWQSLKYLQKTGDSIFRP